MIRVLRRAIAVCRVRSAASRRHPNGRRCGRCCRTCSGRRVVDLGCGFGWFCRWAREAGAAEVLGVDVSEKMLERARFDDYPMPAITYALADLARSSCRVARFDLAYSSLALHYIEDAATADDRGPRGAGARRGISCSRLSIRSSWRSRNAAWRIDAEGRRTWPVDSYLAEGPRTTEWFTPGVVKYHRDARDDAQYPDRR